MPSFAPTNSPQGSTTPEANWRPLWMSTSVSHGTDAHFATHNPSGSVVVMVRREYPQAGAERPNERFRTLSTRWKENTADLSRVQQAVSDHNYLAIIALGYAAVPFILQELQTNGGYWFPALEAITGEEPESQRERETIGGMKRAWLRWGYERGILP